MKPALCLACQHCQTELIPEHWTMDHRGYWVEQPSYIAYYCRKQHRNIRTLRTECKDYLSQAVAPLDQWRNQKP